MLQFVRLIFPLFITALTSEPIIDLPDIFIFLIASLSHVNNVKILIPKESKENKKKKKIKEEKCLFLENL